MCMVEHRILLLLIIIIRRRRRKRKALFNERTHLTMSIFHLVKKKQVVSIGDNFTHVIWSLCILSTHSLIALAKG